MATVIEEYSTWMRANGADLQGLMAGAAQLATALQPQATRRRFSVAQLVNGDAVTVRALADGVGLAAIAGEHGVDAAKILEALAMTVKFATFIGAFA